MCNKLFSYATLVALSIFTASAARGEPAKIDPVQTIQADGLIKDVGEPSHDISGIACEPGTSKRRCVVIDDQTTHAQVVIFDGNTMKGDRFVELIAKNAEVRGKEPKKQDCKKEGKFKDLDGEGVAYVAPCYYVVGSHGCSRNSGKYNRSSFITVRFKLNDKNEADDIERTYRLSDALHDAAPVDTSFTKELEAAGGPDGLNVEGLAVVGDTLFAGLRGPSIGGKAYLVGAKVEDLFAPGDKRLKAKPTVVPLTLGPGIGVRDLAAMPDGRFFGVSGPTRSDPALSFGLFEVSGALDGHSKTQPLAQLKDVPFIDKNGEQARPKAEVILPLSTDGGNLRALVMFDGPANGAPAIYEAALP